MSSPHSPPSSPRPGAVTARSPPPPPSGGGRAPNPPGPRPPPPRPPPTPPRTPPPPNQRGKPADPPQVVSKSLTPGRPPQSRPGRVRERHDLGILDFRS